VPVDKRYATAKETITAPCKRHLTQQGWVPPSEADAAALHEAGQPETPRCHYNGSTSDPVDPTRRISGISNPQTYEPDAFGWHGHQMEQLITANAQEGATGPRPLPRHRARLVEPGTVVAPTVTLAWARTVSGPR
jgi:hypothetical protein